MTILLNDSKLHKIILDGNLSVLNNYLDNCKDVEVDVRDKNGSTALMLAVQQNDFNAVKRLIGAGADVNARDTNMLTPYLCAGANGFHDLLSLTIDAGADTKSVNRFGGTPLLPSSEKGFLRTVQVALDARIHVNHVNKLGWSALLEAVILGDGGFLYSDIISVLLDAGADINLVDRDNLDSLSHARNLNQQPVIDLMTGEVDSEDAFLEVNRLIRDYQYQQAFDFLTSTECVIQDKLKGLYYKGYLLSELQDYYKAVDVFDQALKTAPRAVEFCIYKANSYRLAKNSTQAIKAFDEGISIEPNSLFARYHKSNYLRELGMHEQAIAEMKILLGIQPNRYDFSFHLANSLRSLGRHEESICAIENAITHDFGNPLYHGHKAQSLLLISRNKQALNEIEIALSIASDDKSLIEIRDNIIY